MTKRSPLDNDGKRNVPITVVVKVSKYCNLRCRYCYEFDHLSDRSRISTAAVLKMYSDLFDAFQGRPIEFVWHGGEPFLVPADFFDEVVEYQKTVFDTEVKNVAQTNAVNIKSKNSQRLLELFDSLGVSYDPFGGDRVNTRGQDSQSTVLQNLTWMKDQGVDFGCITTITRSNTDRVGDIYRFFDSYDIPFRYLNIYRVGLVRHQLTLENPTETALGFARALKDYILDGARISVSPFDEAIGIAQRKLRNQPIEPFKIQESPMSLIVDTNGKYYFNSHAYVEECDLGEIGDLNLRSIGANKVYSSADEKVMRTCSSCDFNRFCNQSWAIESPGCSLEYHDDFCLLSFLSKTAELVISEAQKVMVSSLEDNRLSMDV